MKYAFRLFLIGCFSVFLCNCATLFSGKTQKINVTTENGKEGIAKINGQEYKVPALIVLEKENKDKVISLKDCPQQQVLLQKGIETTFWVNIFSAGVFGSTTDYASDAMWKYEPSNVELKCASK